MPRKSGHIEEWRRRNGVGEAGVDEGARFRKLLRGKAGRFPYIGRAKRA